MERARKIDELQARIHDMENEKSRLIAQLSNYRSRCRSAVDGSIEKTRRDEQIINVSLFGLATNDYYTYMRFLLCECNIIFRKFVVVFSHKMFVEYAR